MMCFGLKDRKRVKTNHCVIVLLDDTQLVHELHQSTSGQDLLDVVIKHLNLLETSYFGLKYFRHANSSNGHQQQSSPHCNDYYSSGGSVSAGAGATNAANSSQSSTSQQPVWLDVNKSAIKQLGELQPMMVYFGVKYYASDPCKLAEEITRYQFFLQCKQDILHGRLPVQFDLAVELLALAVQSELGDYDPQRHHDNYVSEFHFLPQQTGELERRAALYHRQLTGQVPATAELNFLERIKWLDLYGCELHPIQYNDDHDEADYDRANENGGNQFAIGLGPMGVLVLRSRNRIAQYAWPRIVKTKCQGRCFLMDVIMEQQQQQATASSGNNKAAPTSTQRNRFGFRLRDKQASRRLRWSLEEHKSFYHLIHSSTTLQQLAAAQRRHQQTTTAAMDQQMKLSQRFRNSIRSAIGFAANSGVPASDHFSQKLIHQHQQQLAAAAAQQQQQNKMLRSSIKSMNQSTATLARQQPTVVRMPSRRYNSNRSLARLPQQQQQQQQEIPAYQANGLALPSQQHQQPFLPAKHQQANQQHHTMVDSQRQQALLMMNQFNQMNAPLARSQTLKPANSKEAKRNPYYQMMMMLAAQQHQAQMQLQQQHQQQQPEVSILPPGQHIVQPSIYRASSVINGINQLGKLKPADLILCQQQPPLPATATATTTMGQQLFNGRPRYQREGRESPRSTKSAMAPSSALKSAGKRLLAKQQQQQLIYGNQADLRPLLQSNSYNQQQRGGGQAPPMNNYSSSADYYDDDDDDDNLVLASRPQPPPLPYSANASPRSTRSARLLLSTAKQHRSKSTGENLHLLHKQQQQSQFANNRQMLLTTATTNQQLLSSMVNHPSLPPPDYNLANQHQLAKPPAVVDSRSKRAAFVMDSKQANLLLLNENVNQSTLNRRRRGQSMLRRSDEDDDNDDYYCSRSDCSSIDNNNREQQQFLSRRRRPEQQQARQAQNRPAHFNGQSGGGVGNANSLQRRNGRCSPPSLSKSQEALYGQNLISGAQQQQQQQDWNSIKRRHNEFSAGNKKASMLLSEQLDHGIMEHCDTNNNNSRQPNNLIKNIPNKQATPILLSMNYTQDANKSVMGNGLASNKAAVQLLNLQRQQLNSQTSSEGSCATNKMQQSSATTTANRDGQMLLSSSSTSSSVASSPKAPQTQTTTTTNKSSSKQTSNPNNHHHLTSSSSSSAAIDSTGSNSTTSGYYAGSNSTGPTSVDSDTISAADLSRPSPPDWRTSQQHQQEQLPPSSQAKIALGSYGGGAGSRLIIGNPQKLLNSNQQKINGGGGMPMSNKSTKEREYQKQQQHFYLGETNNHSDDSTSRSQQQQQSTAASKSNHRQQQWSPLEQLQQHSNSSLKYVSFDV